MVDIRHMTDDELEARDAMLDEQITFNQREYHKLLAKSKDVHEEQRRRYKVAYAKREKQTEVQS